MLNIIHEDRDIIIVNKPSGQLTQGDRSFDVDLVSEVMTYLKGKGEPAYAAVINRLDRPVEGLVLLAKNRAAAARYSAAIQKEGGLNKHYEAFVCGKLPEDKGVMADYIRKDGKNNISVIVPENAAVHMKDAKKARLEYEVISYNPDTDISHVRIHLITGRHHQIRVQFAHRGCPLVGDFKYAGAAQDFKYAETAKDRAVPDTVDSAMESAASATGIARGQIALCAVSLEIEGREYSVVPYFH